MSDLHEKTLAMGQNSVPRLQNSVVLMKNELQNMVKELKPFLEKQPSESSFNEDKYEEYIKKLNPDYYKVQDNYF
jgi:archaellum component FlaC